jgi:WD40 repeat protein
LSSAVGGGAGEAVTLRLRRTGGRLRFQVDDGPEAEFQDLFPLTADAAAPGLVWRGPVGLRSLRVWRQSVPPQPSLLEAGDEWYARGDFTRAAEAFGTLARTAATPEARQEARCKLGFCLSVLQRGKEAADLFEQVAAEPGPQWPVVAACQVWLAALRDNDLSRAEAVFNRLALTYRFEQLFVLVPEEIREQILTSYRTASHRIDLMQVKPELLQRLVRLDAAESLLAGSAVERLSTRRLLIHAYMACGEWDQAREAAEQLLALPTFAPRHKALIVEDYVWLMALRKLPAAALAEVDRRLVRAAGVYDRDYLPLLIQRARLHAIQTRWPQAEADLEELNLRRGELPPDFAELYLAEAGLLRGFFRERDGDREGALAAWREGWAAIKRSGYLTSNWAPLLWSLSGELGEDDVKQILEEVRGRGPEGRVAAEGLRQALGLPFITQVLRGLYQGRHGHETARMAAFYELPMRDKLGHQFSLAAAEGLRLGMLPGPPTLDQEGLMRDLSKGVYEAYLEGRFTWAHALAAALAFNGMTGPLGWDGLYQAVDPRLRGPLAYLYGHRFRRLNKPAQAQALLRTAHEQAAPGSLLRSILDQEDSPPAGQIRRFVGHRGCVVCLALSPDGRLAASGSLDSTVRLWEIDTGKEVRTLEGHVGHVFAVAFSPDGRRLASAGNDSSVRVWDVDTGQTVRRLVAAAPQNAVGSVAFTPDGRKLISAAWDYTVRVWDAETLRPEGSFRSPVYVVNPVFLPDGRHALFAGFSGADVGVHAWDLTAGREVDRWTGQKVALMALALSPDGRQVLAGGWGPTVWLWDVATKKIVRPLTGHQEVVFGVAFSPDGRRALSCGGGVYSNGWQPGTDQTLRLWDVATGQPLAPPFRGHTHAVSACAFTPDGRRALTASYDGTLRLWQLPP